jgi:hypothetical protein
LYLNELKSSYKLPEGLYAELRSAIRYDAETNTNEVEEFMNKLPLSLRNQFMMSVHSQAFKDFPLFINIGNKSFINWVSNHLKPQIVLQG